MSRADMAEVLSRCLEEVTTKGAFPVRTHELSEIRNDNIESIPSIHYQHQPQQPATITLVDEIDSSGSECPLIIKLLTAVGTKSSHHMGIV